MDDYGNEIVQPLPCPACHRPGLRTLVRGAGWFLLWCPTCTETVTELPLPDSLDAPEGNPR